MKCINKITYAEWFGVEMNLKDFVAKTFPFIAKEHQSVKANDLPRSLVYILVSSLVAHHTFSACIRKELETDSCNRNNYLGEGVWLVNTIFMYIYKMFFKIEY